MNHVRGLGLPDGVSLGARLGGMAMKRSYWAMGLLCVGLSGCLSFSTSKLTPEDEAKEKDLGIRVVGDVTEVANPGPWQVSGIGVVTGLNGTGHSPKGTFRNELEQQLLKQKVENVNAFLDDPDNALVLITAKIFPGCSKGDALDIEVTLPPGSKCTSLQGGFLQETVLRNHEEARRLSPEYADSARVITGHVLGRAKGRLMVGLGNPEEPAEQRRGRIWSGGISLVDRPFYLAMKSDDKSVRIATDVANRINFMFQDDARKREAVLRNKHLFMLEEVSEKINRAGGARGRSEMAQVVGKEMIHIKVPHAYRYNPERYLRVVRLMPLREDPEKSGPYRKRLGEMLLDPADTIRAALRLEALGTDSIETLKTGLTNEAPLVRFACAESLLYLNNLAGVDELAKLAEDYPLLRMYCLLALGANEESLCKQKLAQMLTSSDPVLRCAALSTLRMDSDGRDAEVFRGPELRSEQLGRTLWVHKPAPGTPRLVHVSVRARAEVTLFGDDILLQAPIRVPAGSEFVITYETGDDLCSVRRISPRGEKQQQCGPQLEEVLRAMVNLGAGYPEVVDLLRKLDARGGLPCPVAINILPELPSLDRLISEGRELGKKTAALEK